MFPLWWEHWTNWRSSYRWYSNVFTVHREAVAKWRLPNTLEPVSKRWRPAEVNFFFSFLHWFSCSIKGIKIQHFYDWLNEWENKCHFCSLRMKGWGLVVQLLPTLHSTRKSTTNNCVFQEGKGEICSFAPPHCSTFPSWFWHPYWEKACFCDLWVCATLTSFCMCLQLSVVMRQISSLRQILFLF